MTLTLLDAPTRTVLAPGQTAAGTGVSVPVPESEWQQLVACSFRIVTSAVVATRSPMVQVTDGSGVLIVSAVAGFGTTASSTVDYSFAYGLSEWDAASPTNASGPCPLIPLDAGDSLLITVVNVDAGDQLSRVRFTLLQQPRRPDDDDG